LRITPPSEADAGRRAPLTRQQVLEAAVGLADRIGIDALSMRKLAQELGVEAMSLYTHVRNKDDLLNGVVEAVLAEIPIAPGGADWRTSLRRTVMAARGVLLRHPWAPRLIATRTEPGPAMLRYFDTVIGMLRGGGFTLDLTHHALHLLGSRVLGFTQDVFDDTEDMDPATAAAWAGPYPHVTEMALAVSHHGGLGGCDDDFEFAFAFDLILDGLAQLRDEAAD
jgi:AcrR family transcriptional regulator